MVACPAGPQFAHLYIGYTYFTVEGRRMSHCQAPCGDPVHGLWVGWFPGDASSHLAPGLLQARASLGSSLSWKSPQGPFLQQKWEPGVTVGWPGSLEVLTGLGGIPLPQNWELFPCGPRPYPLASACTADLQPCVNDSWVPPHWGDISVIYHA